MSDVARRTCRDGAWLAVFGTDLTVVLPGRERSRAARLWELVDARATFEQVLDALVAPTLSESGEFVLVRAEGSNARVMVRGRPSVSVHTTQGATEVSSGDRVWAEQSFSGAEVMVLALPDTEGLGDELPAVQGLVRVGTVVWGATPGSSPAATAAGPEETQQTEETGQTGQTGQTEQTGQSGTQEPGTPGPETADIPVPPAVPTPPVPPVTAPPVPPVPAVPPSAPVPTPAASALETQAIVGQSGVDDEEETDLVPFEVPADRDGMTRFGEPSPAPAPAGIPGQPQAPAVLSRPVARLVFSHGETVPVDRAVVIGRAPEVRRHAPGEEPRLMAVPSPGQEISSTHLEIRPGAGVDHGAATATDLGSTNGTLVMQPGLPPEELQPGIAMALVPGAVLDLGDGLTIQVTRP